MTREQISIPDNGFCFRRDVPGGGLHRRMCTGMPRVLSEKGLALFYASRAYVPITFDGTPVTVLDVRLEKDVEVVEYTVAGSQRIKELDQVLRQGAGIQVQICL